MIPFQEFVLGSLCLFSVYSYNFRRFAYLIEALKLERAEKKRETVIITVLKQQMVRRSRLQKKKKKKSFPLSGLTGRRGRGRKKYTVIQSGSEKTRKTDLSEFISTSVRRNFTTLLLSRKADHVSKINSIMPKRKQ